MGFLKRWKRNTSKPTDQKTVAQFNLKAYADKLELVIKGDEAKVGGALVMLMLRHEHIHTIINNAVNAANREIARRNANTAYYDLISTFNPN